MMSVVHICPQTCFSWPKRRFGDKVLLSIGRCEKENCMLVMVWWGWNVSIRDNMFLCVVTQPYSSPGKHNRYIYIYIIYISACICTFIYVLSLVPLSIIYMFTISKHSVNFTRSYASLRGLQQINHLTTLSLNVVFSAQGLIDSEGFLALQELEPTKKQWQKDVGIWNESAKVRIPRRTADFDPSMIFWDQNSFDVCWSQGFWNQQYIMMEL